MAHDPVVIVSAARTPMGGFQGDLKGFAAAELGAAAIRAAVERAGVKPEQVEEVIFGSCLPAGQGQAPARQAALGAGLPQSAGATTINKMCGSGMKAAMLVQRPAARGFRASRRRRRHGVHDQRALPAAQGARGPAHGPRPGDGPHVPRRPRRRLREGPPDGHLRRGLRRQLRLHARGPGRLRHRLARARAEGEQRQAGSPGRSRRWRSRRARTRSSSRATSSRSRPTSRRSRRSSPPSARTAR